MEDSSRGEEKAFFAARRARSFPFPSPIPIRATPLPQRVDLTSLKSRLITPGSRILSVTVLTASPRILSAALNAAAIGIFPLLNLSLSLETIIKASTAFFKVSIPSNATFFRRGPSKVKGRVTIAKTKAPHSLAAFAITGAPPVPVPPPSPAEMKILSEPVSTFLISS